MNNDTPLLRKKLDFSNFLGMSKEAQEQNERRSELHKLFGFDVKIEEKIDEHFTDEYVFWLENKVIELLKQQK